MPHDETYTQCFFSLRPKNHVWMNPPMGSEVWESRAIAWYRGRFLGHCRNVWRGRTKQSETTIARIHAVPRQSARRRHRYWLFVWLALWMALSLIDAVWTHVVWMPRF